MRGFNPWDHTIGVYTTQSPRKSLVKYFFVNEPNFRAYTAVLNFKKARSSKRQLLGWEFFAQRFNIYLTVILTGLPLVYIKHINSFIYCFESFDPQQISDLDEFIIYYLDQQ